MITPANANTLRTKWRATIPEGFKLDAEPAIADGNVFVSAHPCYLYAFAVDTGALRWQYKMQLNGVTCDLTPTGPGVGHSTPTVAHGMVFVPYGGAIWALNDQTGAFLWHTTQANYTEVTYADGRLYTTDGVNVYALDLATGGVLWTWTSGVSTAIAGNPAIAVDQGRVWVVNALGLLTALDGATGGFIRSIQLTPQSNNVGPGPTVANATRLGRVARSQRQPIERASALYGIDTSTGAIWFRYVYGDRRDLCATNSGRHGGVYLWLPGVLSGRTTCPPRACIGRTYSAVGTGRRCAWPMESGLSSRRRFPTAHTSISWTQRREVRPPEVTCHNTARMALALRW